MAQHIEILIKHPEVLTEHPRVLYIPELYQALTLTSLPNNLQPQHAYGILSDIAVAAHDYGPPKAGCSYLDLWFGEFGNMPLLETQPSITHNRRIAAMNASFELWEKYNAERTHGVYSQLGLGLTEDEGVVLSLQQSEASKADSKADPKVQSTRIVGIADYILHRGLVTAVTTHTPIPPDYSLAADILIRAWEKRLYSMNKFEISIADKGIERLQLERTKWNF